MKIKKFNEMIENDQREDQLTNTEIVADIRNKLGPIGNLISFCEEELYNNDRFKDMFKKEVGKSVECFDYIRDMLQKINENS